MFRRQMLANTFLPLHSIHLTHLQFISFAIHFICSSSEKSEIKMKLTQMVVLLLELLLLVDLLLLKLLVMHLQVI